MRDNSLLDSVLASLPASIELPAGTGKTELIGRLVQRGAATGRRALVLTHTHAGVDVVRRRLRRFGVPQRAATVRTVDSWSFDLISKMPQLAGITVGDGPDWRLSRQYHEASRAAVDSDAITKMLRASYELVIVDEYQDCQIWQQELITAISTAVPTCVLGDRMQGLFYFGDAVPVDWATEVLPAFPDHPIDVTPWRWAGRNEKLGEWLLHARTALGAGISIDLAQAPVILASPLDGMRPYFDVPKHPDSTVAITQFPSDAALLARRLGGAYTMIEEIEGKHLRQFASVIDSGEPAAVAAGTIGYAINCAFGPADTFAQRHRTGLANGKSMPVGQDEHSVGLAIQAVNSLLFDPAPARVRTALQLISRTPSFRLFRREAWYGILDALRLCETTADLNALDAVISIRTRLSRSGRRPEPRIVGRPLLVKGLEFQHAIIDKPDRYNAHELYVVLSRASTSITVISDATSFAPEKPQRQEP